MVCKFPTQFQWGCIIFIYLGFYVAFNTVQVISRRVVGRAEKTSTYSSLGFCTVNWQPTANNYQLSHLRPCRGSHPSLRGGRRECYHSATVAPVGLYDHKAADCHLDACLQGLGGIFNNMVYHFSIPLGF